MVTSEEIRAYFDALRTPVPAAALHHRHARIRFDTRDSGDRWLVTVADGMISAEPTTSPVDADCVIAAESGVLADVLTGRANAMAAMLRGELAADGDVALLMLTRRMIAQHGPALAASTASGVTA